MTPYSRLYRNRFCLCHWRLWLLIHHWVFSLSRARKRFLCNFGKALYSQPTVNWNVLLLRWTYSRMLEKILFLFLLEWWPFGLSVVKSQQVPRIIFSITPSDLEISSTLLSLMFCMPIALMSPLVILLWCSKRKSLEILPPGPSWRPAKRFHLNLWASLGVRRPNIEACTRRPAKAYLFAPFRWYRKVRNFQTLISLSPSPSSTASSASWIRRPRLRWRHP